VIKASAGLGALGSAVHSNNFLKPKENLLICQCLASNPKQCTVRSVHHLYLKFHPSSLHTWEKPSDTDFSDSVILGLGIK